MLTRLHPSRSQLLHAFRPQLLAQMDAALVKLIKTLPVGGEWAELETIVRIICQGIGLIGAAKAKEAINYALHIEVERWA